MGKAETEKKYSQKFRKAWLTQTEFKDWLQQVSGDDSKAHCKFSKCSLTSRYADLISHGKTIKHQKAAEPFSTQRQAKIQFAEESLNSSVAEGSLALYLCAHGSVASCDHLDEMCKRSFKDSEAAKKMRMHTTKCSEVIKNVLSPHFYKDLLSDIAGRKFSLLLDESNDISVTKLLGMGIIYYSESFGQTVSTFLALTKLEECNADSIVIAVKKVLQETGLNIQNLMAIGTDNASVMVGVNNGVYAKLKAELPSLILIRCLCHSLQLAVTHAMIDTLPRNLEFLAHETYNWFSKSALRQIKYSMLYETINAGQNQKPLKMVQVSNTRWLSIETSIDRILNQWLELKTHFDLTRRSEKCYSAEMLYNMYSDETNRAYFTFLKTVLSDVQTVNKSFQSEKNDPVNLWNDLTVLVQGIAKRIMLPTCRIDPLQNNIESYLDPKPYLGYSFEKIIDDLKKAGSITTAHEKGIRDRCQAFLLALFQQLKQRLPDNVTILQKISLLSVDNILRAVKEPIQPLLEYLGEPKDIDAIETQLSKINLIDWQHKTNTVAFWDEVNKYRDASGCNPFKELSHFALSILILPHSNAQVERIFSQLNIVKTKLRNKMSDEMTNAILSVRFGLKRKGKCCHNYDLPPEVVRTIGSKAAYSTNTTSLTSSQAADVNFDFDGEEYDF